MIRRAEAGDIPALCGLVNGAFAIERFLEGTRTDPERLAGMLARGAVLLLAGADGAPVACIYTEVRGGTGYVGMLAVEPGRQTGTPGRRMMRAAEEHLRAAGCEAIEISVLSLRPELVGPYERYGFRVVGRQAMAPNRTMAVDAVCEEIVMRKGL